jgi:hypothetical protein
MKHPKLISHAEGDFWTFQVPTYFVNDDGIQDGEGLEIKLCRGNKMDENAPRQEGVFTETLLQLCKEYLEGVNKGELASRDTSVAITKIDEALLWIGKRAEDRKMREVQGTYLK